MGLLARLTALVRGSGERNMNAAFRIGGMSNTSTAYGFSRLSKSVYGNPTGYRCVEILCNNFSRPDWVAWKPGTDEEVDSPVVDLLNNPAPGVSGTQLQRSIYRDLNLTGRWIAVKMQGQTEESIVGPTTGLRRLSPQRITIIGNDDDELLGFVYADKNGRKFPLLPEQCVYLRHPHPERDYDGLAPAVMAGLPAETDNLAMQFNYDLLANDGAVPGYLLIEDVTPGEFKEWKAMWESGEYPGKTRFLGGSAGGKGSYVKVGQSNQELAYDQMRQASKQDQCHAFGVPNVLLDPTDATFANMAEARSMLIQQRILPDWTLTSDELTAQLGQEFGVDVGLRLDDIEELSEAEDAIVERGIKLLDRQVLTINEFRDGQGWDPVPWGNEPLAPLAPMKAQAIAAPGQTTATVVPPLGLPEPQKSATKSAKAKPQKVGLSEKQIHAHEQRLERKMTTFFRRQGNVISAKIRGGAGKAFRKAVDPENLYDDERWTSELQDDLAAAYADIIDAFGTDISLRMGGNTFSLDAPTVRKYIEDNSQRVSKYVNDTTQNDLRTKLADLESQGLGIDEIAKGISDYFDAPQRRDGESDLEYETRSADTIAYRSERVARTEVISASNFTLLDSARQSGVATGKTWLTAGGGECDECAGLDGESVGVDDDFSSGDDAPPTHPQCRCTLLVETASGSTEEDSGE